jgi:Leucine-rich repeat (LRR) protein
MWWEEVAALVKHHETLESVSFAFTRPRPLIAHNVMERHYEQNTEILESLIISISNNRRLTTVELECVGLTMDDARQIGRMMKKLKLVTLNLARNSLGRLGAEIISKQLRMCKTIVELNLSANNIEDAGVIAIIMACQDHPTIQRLAIAANDLTSAIIPSLCDYVKSSTRLVTLDVSHNYIGREIIHLLHAVAMSQTLMSLNIGYNAGSESCVGALKHVLMDPPKTNDDPDPIPAAPQLTELDLQGNQLSPEAGVVIRHALTTNTHILHINLEANFISKHDVADIEKLLALNRQGAAFKFRFEPRLLQQKWNLNVTNVDGKKNVSQNKKVPSRTEEDTELENTKEKKKREKDEKNGKLNDPPSCFIL